MWLKESDEYESRAEALSELFTNLSIIIALVLFSTSFVSLLIFLPFYKQEYLNDLIPIVRNLSLISFTAGSLILIADKKESDVKIGSLLNISSQLIQSAVAFLMLYVSYETVLLVPDNTDFVELIGEIFFQGNLIGGLIGILLSVGLASLLVYVSYVIIFVFPIAIFNLIDIAQKQKLDLESQIPEPLKDDVEKLKEFL